MQAKRGDKKGAAKVLGDAGEDLAAKYLACDGFKILERNYKTKVGEIDLIAMKRDTVYFIEVKSRGIGSVIGPGEALGSRQLKRIRRAAEYFLLCNKALEKKSCSFGFIGIDRSKYPPKIECILDAFL